MVENLTDEYKAELRRQALKQVSKWTLAGALALIIFAFVGWMQILRPLIDDYIARSAGGLPSGAVVAFNSSESQTCPGERWKLFDAAKGRVIIGAGHGDRSKLTPRQLGDVGGEEMHQLTTWEMPSHGHALEISREHQVQLWNENSDGSMRVAINYGSPTEDFVEKPAGQPQSNSGKPHNNMPPYIALYFCKKD